MAVFAPMPSASVRTATTVNPGFLASMRRLVVAESGAMKISGHKTASIFRRYDIVAESDLCDAARLLDQKQENQFDHSSARVKPECHAKEENSKVEVLTTQ